MKMYVKTISYDGYEHSVSSTLTFSLALALYLLSLFLPPFIFSLPFFRPPSVLVYIFLSRFFLIVSFPSNCGIK